MTNKLASMKPREERDQRPKEFFDTYHRYARENKPNWKYNLVRVILIPATRVLFRLRVQGRRNVPRSGAVILAPNHASFMDHFFVAAPLRRKVRFVGKSQMFGSWMDRIYVPGGVFPVRRGHRDEEVFITAQTVLKQGQMIGWYTEGGRSRSGKIADRPKPGIGRLATSVGVWVVPAAIHGSDRVRNWKKGQFPRITVRYGKPIWVEQNLRATREEWMEVAEQVLGAIKHEYALLEDYYGHRWWRRRVIATSRRAGRP